MALWDHLHEFDYQWFERKSISRGKRKARRLRWAFGRCAYCGRPVVTDVKRSRSLRYATVDHMIPRSKLAGRREDFNLVIACRFCNNAKADASLIVFLAELRSLREDM